MNRVLSEYREWEENEKKAASLLSAGIHTREFQAAKYDFIQKVLLKYESTANREEKVSLAALKAVGNQLKGATQKRGLRGMMDELFSGWRRQREIKQESMLSASQEAQFYEKLHRMGIGHIVPAIKGNIGERKPVFSHTFDMQMEDGGKAAYSMWVNNGPEGPSIRAMEAMVTVKGDEQRIRHHNFFGDPEREGLDMGRMYNLLLGRAVKSADGSWIKIDVNDADGQGNLKLMAIPNRDDYAVSVTELVSVPHLTTSENGKILQARLEAGEQVRMGAVLDGKTENLLLLADPQSRQVRIMDENGMVITADALKAGTRNLVQDHARELAAKQDQNQSKKNRKQIQVSR